MAETIVYIGLGSNSGDREGSLKNAVEMLRQITGLKVTGQSDILETAPLAGLNQPQYLNSVVQIKTSLSAEELFSKARQIENSLGRKRGEKWAPRTIDLDLLLFGSQILNTPELTIPHPQMHLRSFVLKGVCQFDPHFIHPVLQETLAQLSSRLNGCDYFLNLDVPQLISIAGNIGVGKTTLATKLSQKLNAKLILELYDKNPFLAPVYAGNKDLALDSQLFFLTSRIEQLKPENFSKGEIVVNDYVFDKDKIYAKKLLNNQQFALYEQMYSHLFKIPVCPVLLIYLKDSDENCLNRIHKRNRPYEQKIKLEFLDSLAIDFDMLFADWKTCPVIQIDKTKFDCMNNEHIERLLKQVKAYIAYENR